MRFATRSLFATVFAATLVALSGGQDPAEAQNQQPRFDQEIEVSAVNPAPRSPSDYLLTIDFPFALADVSLPAGQYLFRSPSTSTGNILQIGKPDRSIMYAMVHTTPVFRAMPTERHVLVLGNAAAGEVRPIKAWFLPGRRNGYEFPQR